MVPGKSRMSSWLSNTSREPTSPTRGSLPPYRSLAPEASSTSSPASPMDVELSPAGNASARDAEVEPSSMSPQSDHNDFIRGNNSVWLHSSSSKVKKTHISAKPLSSVNKYALKRMLWPFVTGVVFALAQELFIRQAAGKYVQTYAITEFWMRAIANVLASLAQFFFLAAMTTAIHQMIWWFIHRKRSFMIAQLNVLFSQPSSYLSLTSYPRILTDLPALTVILLSVTVIQLTNIFGPAALQTIPASPQIVSLPVASMAWSDWTGGQAVSMNGDAQEVFTGPSLAWTNMVRSSLMIDRAVVAPTSTGCQSGCSYDLTYAGPALSCSPEEGSTLPSNTLFASTFERGQLNVTWASSSPGAASGAMLSMCFFTQGNYTNAVHLEGTNTSSKVNLVNIGHVIAPAWPMPLSTPVQARNYASVVSAFGNSLAGTVTRDIDSGMLNSTTFATSTALLAINDSVLPSTFKIAESASSNMPTFLEDLFANVTSAFLGLQNAQQSVQVAILPAPGATIYVVRTMVLRLTYLISGSMTLISCILGYICLRRNQVVRRNFFSAFMEATYVPELGEVAQLAKDNRSRFYTSKLIFSPSTGAFTPAPSSR